MKLIIDRNQIDSTPEFFLRHAGYAYIRDRERGTESFVRRLGAGFYPRFHIYFEDSGEKVFFNLHIDQKQPSYGGAHMHNAEYDGEAVEGETARLRSLLAQRSKEAAEAKIGAESELISRVGGSRDYKNIKETEKKKKTWWKFWQ